MGTRVISFLLDQCLKESIGKKIGFDICSMIGVGTVTGFCEVASGRGTTVLTNLTGTFGAKPDVVTDYKFNWVRTSQITITGGNSTQHIHAELSVTPVSGSCTNKTMTGFSMSGQAVIKRITS